MVALVGDAVGTVAQLWRYPVKSMMGEQLDAVVIGEQGLPGDRAWATRDEVRGGIRGAKKIGALMRLGASYATEPVLGEPAPAATITLPDGSSLLTTDDDANDRVSAALDHQVTLWPLVDDDAHYLRGPFESDDLDAEMRDMFAREPDEPLPDLSHIPPELLFYESPPGTYFDAHPLLLMTTQSLDSLQELAPDSVVDVRRFRPNILIDATPSADPFPEQGWLGQTLDVGGAKVEVLIACPRCVMITRGFDDLPEDRALMRHVVKGADQNLGVYARVVEGGPIAVGDGVSR
jgi:uncharacterized protein YcbX